jgi:hypothetical protein
MSDMSETCRLFAQGIEFFSLTRDGPKNELKTMFTLSRERRVNPEDGRENADER